MSFRHIKPSDVHGKTIIGYERSHNTIEFIFSDGTKLSIWAEVASEVAAGIPGIYVDDPNCLVEERRL